jgi:hypothetical protein
METVAQLLPILSALVLLVAYLERRFTRLEERLDNHTKKFELHLRRHHPDFPFIEQER